MTHKSRQRPKCPFSRLARADHSFSLTPLRQLRLKADRQPFSCQAHAGHLFSLILLGQLRLKADRVTILMPGSCGPLILSNSTQIAKIESRQGKGWYVELNSPTGLVPCLTQISSQIFFPTTFILIKVPSSKRKKSYSTYLKRKRKNILEGNKSISQNHGARRSRGPPKWETLDLRHLSWPPVLHGIWAPCLSKHLIHPCFSSKLPAAGEKQGCFSPGLIPSHCVQSLLINPL